MGAEIQMGDGWAILPEAGILMTEPRVSHAKSKGPIGGIASVPTEGDGTGKVMTWGHDDQLPNYREQLVAENNIVPSLLATKRDITIGRGLMAYTEEIVDGKQVITEVKIPTDAREFFERNEVNEEFLPTSCRNDIFHAAVPVEFVANAERTKINSIRALECRHLRAEERDAAGRINHWYWKGDWGHQRGKVSKSTTGPAQRIPVYDRSWAKLPKKFITVATDNLLCLDEYYPTPYWWGSEEWIKLANCVPEFHLANMKHGYSFRVHIQLPKGYFLKNMPTDVNDEEGMKKALDDEKAAKTEFLRKLNAVLQGVKNAGKSVMTEYEIDKAIGKDYPGVKITPISLDLKDEALLKLFAASNEANMSAQGVHPTLANIQTQGKLSAGSEIRNAFLLYVAIKTPGPRMRMLKAINLVKRVNGWPPEVKYGFRDMLITTLDEDKSGVKEAATQEASVKQAA